MPASKRNTEQNVPKSVDLMLMVMRPFERLVLTHLKDIFAYRANRSMDGTVNIRLHYIVQHLDLALIKGYWPTPHTMPVICLWIA